MNYIINDDLLEWVSNNGFPENNPIDKSDSDATHLMNVKVKMQHSQQQR